MPDRILRESIRTSDTLARLTAFQELCFLHLIVTVDDNGTHDARPNILAKALFPARNSIRPAQIADTLRALSDAELVDLYEVEGKPFVRLRTWDRYQETRQGSKRSSDPGAPTVYGMELMSAEEASRITKEQSEVLDAAEDAGFPKTTAIYDQLINLYAEFGKDAVLEGIAACVGNNVIKTNYLRGCCRRLKERQKQEAQKAPDRPRRDATGHEDWDEW